MVHHFIVGKICEFLDELEIRKEHFRAGSRLL